MVKRGYTPEQIINKLREAEVLLSQGAADARFDEALAPCLKMSLLKNLVNYPLAKMKMPPLCLHTWGHFHFSFKKWYPWRDSNARHAV